MYEIHTDMKKITFAILGFASQFMCAQTPVAFSPTSDFSGGNFGSHVQTSNGEILVSSGNALLPGGEQPGKVYLFKMGSNGLEQTNAFYPNDALFSDNFGSSFTIKDDFIAIGSPNHDANFENTGAVYVSKKTNNVWSALQKITAPDGAVNSRFGSITKIHNNHLFISAIGEFFTGQGAVYVYNFDGNSWVFSQRLTVPGLQNLGVRIEAANDKIVVLSGMNGASNFNTFTLQNGSWVLQSSIYAGATLEENLADMCLSNNQLYVIYANLNMYHRIAIFNDVNNSWVGTDANIQTPGAFSGQKYTTLKVSGDTMLLGSTGYTLQFARKFPLLLFKKINDNWVYQTAIYGNGASNQDDYFGASIDIDGDFAVVGAPKEGIIATGNAYYFDATLSTEKFEKKLSIVYPNPTSDLIFIKNNSQNVLEKVEIFSINGSLIASQNSNLEQISTLTLSAGVYFLKLHYSNEIEETFKIFRK